MSGEGNASPGASAGEGTQGNPAASAGEASHVAAASPAGDGEGDGDGTSIVGEHNQQTDAPPMTAEQKKRFKDHLKTFYPDQNFDDNDDAVDEYGIKLVDELSEYKNKNIEYNKKIMDAFDAEPTIVNLIRDVIQGAPLMESLARHVDLDSLKPAEGDPNYEGWQKGLKDRETKRKEQEVKAKEFDENVQATAKELRTFLDENNLNEKDPKFDQFVNQMNTMLNDAYNGKIDKGFFSLIYKGMNFEKAVETAMAQGEVKGKNAKIKAEVQKESATGDGLPNLKPSGEMDEKPTDTSNDRLFKTIDEFNNKRKSLADLLSKP